MHKNIIICILSIGLFLGSTFVQADNSSETPQQGLSAIIELYKQQDWNALVKTRCVDSKHAESEEALQEMARSLSSQFSESASLDGLVVSFQSALAAGHRLESEGTVAVFSSEQSSVRLSKMHNGAWGLRF